MKKMSEAYMSIDQASEFSGLPKPTIRYYEQIGLLPYAERKPNGHRIYSKEQLEGMIFLTRLKTTGMKLEEIKRYLDLSNEGPGTIQKRVSILEEQRKRIGNEIKELNEIQKIIDYKMEHYKETLLNPDLSNVNCNPDE
ncbi:MerR family transcriptional regulator [Terribacillus sp. 7520-G]|uniref:MerR family transcriptional regulator n=1 Tax=Terribacillus TaxID=459532 RepID=UPI000BA6CE72|nr:MerR family transcriptional regulator [Terribacillus sp. 7520-G]PAD38324.1 MerR family transcriptional regulator [Terribacillus sp. 7520-G]